MNNKKVSSLIISSLLLAIAVIWLSFQLWDNFKQIQEATLSFTYWRLLAALPFSIMMLYLTGIIYYFLLIEITYPPPLFINIFLPYLSSQIVRYLPGKIWSIIYQAKEMKEDISAHLVWELNLTQFSMGIAMSSIAIAWLILFSLTNNMILSLLILSVLVVCFYLMVRFRWFYIMTKYFIQLFYKNKSEQNYCINRNLSTEIMSSLIFEWIFYFLAWIILLYNNHSLNEIMQLAVLYIAAWLIGFAVMVVPGGLMIRESAFISFGCYLGFETGNLAFYALLGRFLFTLGDIFGALIAHIFLKRFYNFNQLKQ